MSKQRIGDLLIAKGLIDQTQLKRALKAQLIFGGHIGTNLIELAYIGMPMGLTSIVDHQHRFARYLADSGCADYVGALASTPAATMAGRVLDFVRDGPRQSSLRQKAMNVIDGKGGERLCEVIRRLAQGSTRPVEVG